MPGHQVRSATLVQPSSWAPDGSLREPVCRARAARAFQPGRRAVIRVPDARRHRCAGTCGSRCWTQAIRPARRQGMPVVVITVTSRLAAPARTSICGFPVGVAVCRAFEDPRGGRDLGPGRLQDRLPARAGPGGERRAQVAVVGVIGRDRSGSAGRRAGRRKVRCSAARSVIHWADLAGSAASGARVSSSRWALVAGSGSAERSGGKCWPGWRRRSSASAATARCRWARVAWSQSARSAIRLGEHGLALPVGPLQGLVAGGQLALGCGAGRGRRAGRRRGPRRRRAGRPGGRPRRRRGPDGARRRRTGGPRRSR